MTDNQRQIRDTVERWIEAIRARDIDGVLAAHTDDLVMFDATPPYDGVRGTAAYRDSWPPFSHHHRPAESGRAVADRPRAPLVPDRELRPPVP
ncbi:hypothetical protein MPRF_10610 [Mycolicibacterium parafortuitum]|uniref:SnoaL-like domain-containing protein n=1 Tax=Mycolicibacterium parafortuitum TaxID=39692 RepID=A0A7I7TY95_MYCPF|nr:hypothetical protein MPRF_10610 [Mycolicibacterium parafortuitum]